MEEIVSVIVPVYNVEQYVRRCMDSILRNSYKKLEVICVDDGSTDASGVICDDYAASDERVSVIHKENGGISSARNAGLEVAAGDYIAFIDSDDWIHQDYIQTLMQNLKKNNADLSICGYLRTSDDEISETEDLDLSCRLLTKREAACSHETKSYAWGRIYKREIIGHTRFEEDAKIEDAIFNAELFSNHEKLRVVYMKAPLYFYYVRQGSLMTNLNATTYDELCSRFYGCAKRETDGDMKYVWALECIKRGLAAGYLHDMAGDYAKGKKSKEKAWECLPMLGKQRYIYQIFLAIPHSYRAFRAINDPDLLRWELRRLKEKFK